LSLLGQAHYFTTVVTSVKWRITGEPSRSREIRRSSRLSAASPGVAGSAARYPRDQRVILSNRRGV
jgi:hypothetical protein